jgi:glycosyltransferase involved in cell wall biosynthesis
MQVMARVHAYPPDHPAGAEETLHALLVALVERGHRAEVWLTQYCPTRQRYELDGVLVHPLGSGGDMLGYAQRAGAIVSHLESDASTAELAAAVCRPHVVIHHNTMGRLQPGAALTVFNAEWVQQRYGSVGIVVRPPVDPARYATTPGDRVTLVNLTPAKGGDLLAELVRRMPDVQFLAVKGGYGHQVVPPAASNVEVLDTVPNSRMRDEVYARTRVLLMPSEYESWGRVGVEAMASGIPVLATPTPGLLESLGTGGTFIDRGDLDGWMAAIAVMSVEESWRAASKRALKRSAELRPDRDLAAWCAAVEALASDRGRRP